MQATPATRHLLACALVTLLAPACNARSSEGAGGAGRVVIVSIDGMMPETYLDPDRLGLAIPTLRSMVARGASARAVESVFPTVTFPAHTTIVTGAPPNVHGVTSNRTFDPLGKNHEGWYWYTEDIRVPTLWSAVEAQGRAAALVTWPVTVGAKVSFVVPEFWRAGTPDDQKLLRSVSTPGLLDKVARGYPDLWKTLMPEHVRDVAQFEIAKYLVANERFELMLVHAWNVDDAHHNHGPRSAEAKQSLEHADRLIGELLAALEQAPDWNRTTLVVLSDHGFLPSEREVRLNVLWRQRGLVTLDANGKVASAKVASIEDGGCAYVHVLDLAAEAEVMAALETVQPAIGKIFTREEIAAAGGDRTATFALAAAPGYGFSGSTAGTPIVDRPGRGNHGYPPSEPAMAASFVAFGPNIRKRDLGAIRMIDVGPTIARWLGVTLTGATGTAIPDL